MMGGRRGGKSVLQAQAAAAALKAGKRVGLARAGGSGIEEVVCVPGFDDGKQIMTPDSRYKVGHPTFQKSAGDNDKGLDPSKS